MTQKKVTASFVACGRCSFFLTSYRLIHQDYETAVEESSGGWLNLSWNRKTGDLILKSYGSRIDRDIYRFEGICPECKRRYVYSSATATNEGEAVDNDLVVDAVAEETAAEKAGAEQAEVENSAVEQAAAEDTEPSKGEGGKPNFQVEVSPGKAT